ncbi:MAG: MBL fold metallo-hydrolase, partial [Limisphaerales bacterium]
MQSHIERFFVPGLAHASYLIVNQHEAAVVDPQREVDAYILEAKARGASIKAILNTHPHADFASGFMELAQKTGAKVYTSHLAPVTYPHLAAKENDVISLGEAQLRILETPGHSPDSLSFVLEEEQPMAVFTGDLLFVGDVGRPDLRDADADPTDLAG